MVERHDLVESALEELRDQHMLVGASPRQRDAARDERLGPRIETTVRAMCKGYLDEQRQMRAAGDDTALAEKSLDDYKTCLATVCKVFGDMHPRAFKPTDAARYLKMRRQQGHGVRANKEMSALS